MRRALVLFAFLLAACGRGASPAERGQSAPRPAPSVPTTVAATVPTTVSSAVPTTVPTTVATTVASTAPAPAPAPSGPGSGPAVTLLAAGDIASCNSTGDEATAALLDARPGAAVATLGDNAYDSGTPREFAQCYAPKWGRQLARTRPAVGNHEYGVPRAAGYFAMFGAAAGPPSGWYSYNLGAWHVVVLNSNCAVVGCEAGGAQERWLRADLAANPAACTLAYWHHPRFSSGSTHGPTPAVQPLYNALYQAGADVVLSAHEHNYERFAPLDPTGMPDAARGIRQFVVGTGGNGRYPFGPATAGSEVRNAGAYGVLALTLQPGGYQWQFVAEAGKSFTDSGSASCH